MSFIVPSTLASPADYTAWSGDAAPPANIANILRSCSSLVLDASEGVLYDVDSLTGLATDTATKNALRDAACIQASAWVALGIDPATGGVITANIKRAKRFASASIEYAGTGDAANARAAAYAALVPEASRFLQQRNLLGTDVWSLG